jgi:hypothetical protein
VFLIANGCSISGFTHEANRPMKAVCPENQDRSNKKTSRVSPDYLPGLSPDYHI